LDRLRPSRHDEEAAVAVTVPLPKALDKAYEDASLNDILKAPASALAGISDGDATRLKEAFGILKAGQVTVTTYRLASGLLSAPSKGRAPRAPVRNGQAGQVEHRSVRPQWDRRGTRSVDRSRTDE
jgi:hypothetical protein